MSDKKDKKEKMTLREFLRNPKKMGGMVRDGTAIEVTKNGAPFFTAVPAMQKKPVTGKDVLAWNISIGKGQPKDLSSRIDEIVYGE